MAELTDAEIKKIEELVEATIEQIRKWDKEKIARLEARINSDYVNVRVGITRTFRELLIQLKR